MKQERRRAAELGGRAVPGSGAVAGLPGDIRLERFLGEHKWTAQRSFRLTRALLLKIGREAAAARRTPFVLVEFMDREQRPEDAWLVLPYRVARPLLRERERVLAEIDRFLEQLRGMTDERGDGAFVVLTRLRRSIAEG